MKLLKKANERLNTERFWLICAILMCAELSTLASIAVISLYYGELLVALISAIIFLPLNWVSKVTTWEWNDKRNMRLGEKKRTNTRKKEAIQ